MEKTTIYPESKEYALKEGETKPTPVLLDIEAGCRTNKLNDVFHLPKSVLDGWQEKILPLSKDLTKSIMGRPTKVGFELGQQHIVDFLQRSCSQQMILSLAASNIYRRAIDAAEHLGSRIGSTENIISMLEKMMKDMDIDQDGE